MNDGELSRQTFIKYRYSIAMRLLGLRSDLPWHAE